MPARAWSRTSEAQQPLPDCIAGDTFGATAQDAILKLFGRLPKGGEGASRLQTLLFSATLHSPEIRELATKICQNPVFIDLKASRSCTPPARA